ncbi:hypothetical protein LTR70_008625 [Exophiala xenobiotica]|uniref:Uncharacterized protein n=1 Tax=Lithohypha guttulata TaxID=1690604 RepID=A0ABR0K184_9EURO|nr:hypothetical protein LTR24_008024 [Lithohypha guttulata]KAK5311703.1 hypothetical protein LTR70_008625 [Exophiala xenobiotica]
MSTYFYGSHQQHVQNPHPMMQQTNHHGRSRRNQRMSSTQPSNRQYRQQQQQQQQKQVEKVVVSEAPALTAFRARFEAGRSFDLDDDLEFCPNLLTWDERQSVTSGSSDRSSLSSGSPQSSPLQHQIQPHLAPALSLPSGAHSAYVSPPTSFAMNHNLKLHQPSAIRSRNPIPIVNPDTRTRMSPPSSLSPGMMQQATAQRRW